MLVLVDKRRGCVGVSDAVRKQRQAEGSYVVDQQAGGYISGREAGGSVAYLVHPDGGHDDKG